MQLFFEISGWIFGLISCIVAVIQTIEKNKYKKIINSQKAGKYSTVQQARTGDDSTITQVGGTYEWKK